MAKALKKTQTTRDANTQEIISSFRHLREQLSPFLKPEYRKIMEQVEMLATKEKNIEPAYKAAKSKKIPKEELFRRLLQSKG